LNITIGENIRKLRKLRGVTQEALAEYLNMTPQAISRWESGAGFPAIEYLPDLAGFFGVSVDELLGVKLSEREAKREEIYRAIARIAEGGYNPDAVGLLREAHAEFPGDRTIRFALANALASAGDGGQPEKAGVQEAEKILWDLVRQADHDDFRFSCIKRLAVMYKDYWHDEHGYEEIVSMLPEISSCREFFLADYFGGANQVETVQHDVLRKLSQWFSCVLRDYVCFGLPNEPETWNSKLDWLDWVISFCEQCMRLIGEKDAGMLEANIAVLHRYKATYYVAQGKADETLSALEAMCDHAGKIPAEPAPGVGKPLVPDKESHNFAWYCLSCMNQDRYNPIRDTPRFRAVVERLAALSR
jgi:transcriptional regulator with XRE-family HTH domain